MRKFITSIIFIILIILFIGVNYHLSNNSAHTSSEIPTTRLSIFGDRNKFHLEVAQKLGVTPVADRNEAKELIKELVLIESNNYYKVDKLTHSIPYLTSGADSLLKLIGKNFQDSLQAKGYAKHRIIVTSVLRTENDVTRLRNSGNPNAAKRSAHMYGTTIDITYARFDCLNPNIDKRYRPNRKELKFILSQVIKDLKIQRKCYALYEIRQRCFHITSRIE